MKIGGVTVTPPSQKVLVLERDQGDIVFLAEAVQDFDDFNKLCPEPTPPKKMVKGVWKIDETDQPYKQMREDYQVRQFSYIVLKSLEPSEIEWETVDMDRPSTWSNWVTDLRDAGLTGVEIGYVKDIVWEANCLDEEKLKAARESFVLGRQKGQSEPSSQNTEQPSS